MENASEVQLIESRPVWKRGLIMLLFAIAFGIGQMVLNIITIVQFLWLLTQHERNEYLARSGASLANWFAEVARFQSGATEDKPFPWRPWS
jgi:hypothetical protein